MQAIVYTTYGTPDVLHLKTMERPAPKDNEVLIRVHAAAVTTVDCDIRQGDALTRLIFGLRTPRKPVLGTEFAGEIVAIGKQVRRFQVDDQVYAASGMGFGAHAEYLCLTEDGPLARKPENATYAEAAAICEGGLTALPFLRDRGEIKPGDRVLINGASGAVGSSAVQLARHFGAEVTGVCGPSSVELVRSLGADRVIDYTREDFTRTGQTYDIIFDAVGKSSFSRCKGSLRSGGVYLSTVASPALFAHVLWTAKFGDRKARIAATGLRPGPAKARDLVILKELTESGALRPVIDGCYPAAHIAEAHRRVETGHKKGHVVVTLA